MRGRQGVDVVDTWERSRAQIWRRDAIASAIAEKKATLLRGRTPGDALEVADAALRRRSSLSAAGELSRYALAAAALEIASSAIPVEIERIRFFHVEATRCLRRVGISRKGSRLSDLHQALVERARAIAPDGDALWARVSGVGPDPALRTIFDDGAEISLRLLEHELAGASKSLRAPLHLAGARVLRLGGRFAEAEQWLCKAGAEVAAQDVAWERLAVEAMRAGDPGGFSRALRADAVTRTGPRMLELYLWTRACKSKHRMRELPAATSLRRSFGDEGDEAAWHIAVVLERAYKASLPLSARISSVLLAADGVDVIGDPALLMLCTAACARWLSRFKQAEESGRLVARYRALSLSASDGNDPDVFRFELGAGAPHRSQPPDAFDSSILRLGFELVKARLRASDNDASLEAYAELVAYHTSALKGPLMKLGQILSFYGVPLPPVSLALLATLQDGAAPLPFAMLRGVLEADLGRSGLRAFADIDPTPVAVGSIGQVHRATLATGENVAVKIQFPDIRTRLERDFRALEILLPLAARMLPGWDLGGIVDELRVHMRSECDYRIEAQRQSSFRERLADEPRMTVPRVHDALTTARVLTADYFEGQTFAEFVRSATPEARRWASEVIFAFVFRTVLVDRAFNTDMHPGNLLFGQRIVCFLDFGNVRTWDHVSRDAWLELVTSMLAADRDRVESALASLDLLPGVPERSLAELVPKTLLMKIMNTLSSTEAVRFDKNILVEDMTTVPMPPHYLYGARVYWGLRAILADLDSEVRVRDVALDVLRRHGDEPVRAALARFASPP